MNAERSLFRLPPSVLRLLPALLLLPLSSGCGASGLVEISGAVTYDGEPVRNGRITFLPPDGNGPTAAAIVADGKYAVAVFPGPKLVKIEGYKVVGRRPFSPGDPASPMVDATEPIIPAKYNERSELKSRIGRGTRVLNFNLKR